MADKFRDYSLVALVVEVMRDFDVLKSTGSSNASENFSTTTSDEDIYIAPYTLTMALHNNTVKNPHVYLQKLQIRFLKKSSFWI